MSAVRPPSRSRSSGRPGRGRAARLVLVLLAVLSAVLPLLDWLHEGDHGCADRSVACYSTAASPDFDPPIAADAVSGWDLAPGTSAALLVAALAAVAFARARDRRAAGALGGLGLAASGVAVIGGIGALDHAAHHQLVTTPVLQGGLPTTGTWLWDLSAPAVLSLVAGAALAVGIALLFHADRPRGRLSGAPPRAARRPPRQRTRPSVGSTRGAAGPRRTDGPPPGARRAPEHP